MKLAIVGSRSFKDQNALEEAVNAFCKEHGSMPVQVISGGAAGADTGGELWAKRNNIPIVRMSPDWAKHGRAAGIIRNTDIVNASTHVIAFPSHKGKGTQDTIKKAERAKKVCKVVWID